MSRTERIGRRVKLRNLHIALAVADAPVGIITVHDRTIALAERFIESNRKVAVFDLGRASTRRP
jgi:hypothetical protein